MTLDTDLSRSPYFDDFEANSNFYQVLYRPSVAVQARELNQMQTILQDQIDKFGRHIFREGSVVEGCAFTFDNNYNFVKIRDNYANNFAIGNVSDFIGRLATNINGLQARIVNVTSGFESQDPNLNTLYVKYLNSAVFSNGAQQFEFSSNDTVQILTDASINVGNVVVASVSSPTGKGYAFTTTEGVIFKKGYFIRVAPQTLIVTKYSNVPDNLSVGFEALEEIITPEIDTELLDNAAGSPNFEAPGAHRLKLVPTLVTRTTSDISNTTTFFSLCDFKAGLPVSIKNDPQYAALAKELARRTFETNGDYIVNPFLLSTEKKFNYTSNTANTTHLSMVSSPGIGYVKGYRVEFINNNTTDLRKALDYNEVTNQLVTANFGSYFNTTEFVGDFNNDAIAEIEIHNVAKVAVSNGTFLNTSYSSATKIGTAFVRGVEYYEGTPGVNAKYSIYIFNISMLPGQRITDARSLIYYSGSLKAVADIILEKDFSNNNISKLQESDGEAAIFPFGQRAIRREGFSNTAQFVYRNRSNADFVAATGTLSLTLPAAAGSGIETFNYGSGFLNQSGRNSFIVVPVQTGYSNNKTGTVSVNVSSAFVNGTSTAFTTQYRVGDYFFCNTSIRRIVSITNSTLMTVSSNLTFTSSGLNHQKVWPAGAPIDYSAPGRTIEITSPNTAVISLGETANANFQTTVYFDILRSATVPIQKTLKKSTYIKIQANTNPGGTAGPWCLGIPDVIKLNAVYVDNGGGTYSTSNPIRPFQLDSGQRDSYYGLAYVATTTPIAPNATLLVSVDNLVADPSQGVGFFTAGSYPVDDNIANTEAIRTWEIPVYRSSAGGLFDLRDNVDFRPYAQNTAIANATVSTATVNPSANLTLFANGAFGSYLPTPGSNFESTIQYYLPRKDRVSLTTAGEILITEGTPALVPVPPADVPGTMTIGTATLAPYPSLTPTEARQFNRYDYAVQTNVLQTKRYTMADINKINTRIDRLEYYTSLSLLEQATTSLLVRSGDTGQNRFKNGILVDPFRDHSIGNTNDENYMIAIDDVASEARPYFRQQTIGMRFDPTASTAVKKGYVIMLPHTSNNVNQQQPFASKFRNCIEGDIYNYRGTVTLDPPAIMDADITQKPVINSNIDLSSNWVNRASELNSMFGSTYSNWTDFGTEKVVGQQSSDKITGTSGKRYAGGQLQTWQTSTVTTLAQQQQQIKRSFVPTTSETSIDLGNYISNVSVQKYVPARQIFFIARGMRPNTRLYVYLDSVAMSQDVLPLTPYTGALTPRGGNNFTNLGNLVYISNGYGNYQYGGITEWGNPVTSDANGNAYGILAIPAGLFKQGSLEFRITDIADLAAGEGAVSTQASIQLFAAALAIEKSRNSLQIRSPSINIEEEKLTRTIQRASTTNTNTWQYFDTSIKNPHCPPENAPPNISQISQGFGPPRR